MRFLVGFWIPRIIYHRVPLSGEKPHAENDEYVEEPSKRLAWHNIITYTAIIMLAVSLVTISTLYIQLLHQHAPRPLLTCGTSIEGARRAGCSFDRLTKTWLPAACPRYYEQEFVQFPSTANITEWKYWTDLTATKEITDEDMAGFAETRPRQGNSWVSTMRMHLAHCAFGLMRRSSALDAGERIDLATVPLDHTNHCIELLLQAAMHAPGIDAPLAKGNVIFGAC
ncbi:hypothetical protein F5Y19DRAFT_439400 [Xylariaceae sp. FL1651]|nr:hypothetical protein F5Y19DRAFT_439400 [Xylariaceae sp. FL1651]